MLRSVASLLLSRSLTRFSQVLGFLALARALSVSDFGTFGLISSAILVGAQLGQFGLQQGAAAVIGRREMAPGEAYGSAMAMLPPLSLLTTCAILLVVLFRQPAVEPLFLSGVVFVASIGFVGLAGLQGVALGGSNIPAFAVADAGPRILFSAVVAVLYLLNLLNLPLALIAYAGGFIAVLPWSALQLLPQARPIRLSAKAVRALVVAGFPFALNQFLLFANTRTGLFSLNLHGGGESVGQFYAAQRLTEIFLEVASAASLVVFSNAVSADRGSDFLHQSARVARFTSSFFLVGGLVAAAVGPVLLPVLLGSEYAGASAALQVLCIGLAASAGSKIVHGALLGLGHSTQGALVLVCGMVANAGAAWLLVPHYGVVGASIALVVSHATIYVLAACALAREGKLPVASFFIIQARDIADVNAFIRSRLAKVEV